MSIILIIISHHEMTDLEIVVVEKEIGLSIPKKRGRPRLGPNDTKSN